jgi:preprotein translocase subunit YajC
MKKRWLLNLLMLLVVAGLVTFLYLRPQADNSGPKQYEVSTLKLADFNAIEVVFPTQKPTSFEKVDGLWHMTSPYKSRADQVLVQRILAIIAAKSTEKLPATDLAKYGLDNPELRLKLNKVTGIEEFIFGTFNSITEEQYVAYKDGVYLLPGSYSEAASTQPIELIDKNPLSIKEAKSISGFNFAHLEQWEEVGLNVDIADGKWKVNVPKAKPTQDELNEWLEFSWKQAQAKQVELYSPDSKSTYVSFEVKLNDGTKVRFEKIQESPELLLGRPDEGILYHFNNDVGFTMLNPPLHLE